ncbi:SDR family NAD(P)-dependent oxidoreductase [Streptomyces sp. NPDC059900]|uniref:SDR family NAD(P)-dependent oxidoreductase n=1 Tax=Streptomyces sp. NPDC059900 TaxID=3155816 RepID=UPI0034202919
MAEQHKNSGADGHDGAGRRDDIAVIGMACRYPGGVDSPDRLWELVSEGRDGVGEFPDNRDWHTEELYDPSFVRQGGFLHDADTFDAAFFGIRPAEAIAMDPQQRILLQVAWESIERAGIVPSSLKGSSTGVFVGVMPNEYGQPLWKWQDETAGFMGTGTSPSVASGRISYLLGLEGPAITIDTACSSSGVAIHQAVRSLRNGETDLALAGGCTVLAGPGMFVDYARKGALSPDGRCRTFADTANGTVWAEGAGVLVLEPLSKAKRLGRRILGVIKGTAVNQDGASNGLTAPSGRAQVKVINQALTDARLRPGDIQLVEAHGTATKLGDPIEANAIQATYGQGEREEPVWIGSFKSSVGHSMAAAGVGGVIKCLTAMKAATMPKTLHVEGELNSHVDWSTSVDVLREARAWPTTRDGVRRCAVSSFGVSGTNSHVILESWDPEPQEQQEQQPEGVRASQPKAAASSGADLLKLSAKTPSALRAYAAAVAGKLASGADPLPGVAHALATAREDFDHRAVVVGSDRDHLLGGLRALAAQEEDPAVVQGEARRVRRPVFVFPGQGSQWPGMAARLLDESEVFRVRVRECVTAFEPHLDFDLMAVLSGADQETDLERTDVVQPLIFTMMLGLAELWRSAGVEPAAVVGHSQGEVAAATLAGTLSLSDAARVVACRSRILEESGRGGMAAVAVSPDKALALAAEAGADLVVAATNGPEFVILSGDDEPGIQRLLDLCEDRGVYARRVPAKCASHSPVMAELQDQIMAGLDGIAPSAGSIPVFSTVEARQFRGEDMTAEYWYRNLRGQVRFAETIAELTSHGYDAFVEISPHPVLLGSLESILREADKDAPVCATLKRDQGTYERFMTAAAEAYVQGHSVDWNVLRAAHDPARTAPADLPTYPFEGVRFWLPSQTDGMRASRAPGGDRSARGGGRPVASLADGGHPWISSVIESADGTVLMSGRLSLRSHPWLMDHRVRDTALLPGTAFAELLLSAGRELGCGGLDELLLRDPLLLPMDGSAVDVQVSVEPAPASDSGAARAAAIFSRPVGGDSWLRNADGLLAGPHTAAAPLRTDVSVVPGAAELSADGLYEDLLGLGYGYGEAFRGVRSGEYDGDWVRSRVVLPEGARVNHRGFAIHPALVDAALHAAVRCGLLGEAAAGNISVPFVFSGVRIGGDAEDTAATAADECYAVARRVAPDAITLTLADDDGRVLLSVDRMVVRGLALPGSAPDLDAAALYAMAWDDVTGTDGTDSTDEAHRADGAEHRLCVVAGDGALAAALRETARGGIAVATLDEAMMVVKGLPGSWQVVLAAPALTGEVDEQVHSCASWALETVQRWLRAADLEGRVLLTCVTRDAVAVPGDDAFDLGSSALWGMVRSAQTEHPGQFRIIDVSSADLSGHALLEAALKRTDAQLAVRSGRILRPQLAPHPATGSDLPDLGDGTVVITGGTGTIGRELARHLVTRWGARSLALLSRSGSEASGIDTFRGELTALGAEVQVIRTDVSDAQDISSVLGRVRSERPIVGVVHAAGVLDDSIVSNMTPDQLHKVLRSKVDSALNLDAATAGDELRFFTLFSSLYGVLGGPGQANYAGANTFLDQFAHWRRSRGRPANSVAWGLWAQATGMTGHLSEGDLLRLRRNGVAPFEVAEGLALFDDALGSTPAALVGGRLAVPESSAPEGSYDGPFLLGGLAAMRGTGTAAPLPPVRRPGKPAGPKAATGPDTVRSRAAAEPRSTASAPAPATGDDTKEAVDVLALLQSADASHDQRVVGVLTLVKECVGGLLGLAPGKVDAQRSFYEMGFDSLTSMELRVRLGRKLGTRLGATVVFDFPTPESLAQHVVEQFAPAAEEPEHVPAAADAPATTASAPTPAAQSAPTTDTGPSTRPTPLPTPLSTPRGGPGSAPQWDAVASEPFPLTKLQEAYLAGRKGDFELGNVSTYLYVEVDLVRFDVRAAERALRRLVERHEMLRAVFDPAGGQRILSRVPEYTVPVEDLRHLTADEREQRLAALREELKAHTFDTASWPLFIVRTTRIDDAVTRLHMGIDVLISDGGSSALLFQEWADLYHDPARALERPGGSFRDHVLKVRAFGESEEIEPSKEYWRSRAASLPAAPELPLAVRLGEVARPVFANRFLRIETPQWEQFRRNAAAAGVTASGAILTAYCQVLARWSKSPDFTVNVLVSHRSGLTDEDMSKTVGNFSSTSLLEVHVDEKAAFKDVAAGIQRQLILDMEHTAYTGLDVLRDLGRLDAGAGRARMPVVFNSTIGGAPATGEAAAGPVGALCRMGESGTPVWSGVRTPQVILDHTAFEENGGLILNWDVVEEVFPAGVVDDMFSAYERLIRELCC